MKIIQVECSKCKELDDFEIHWYDSRICREIEMEFFKCKKCIKAQEIKDELEIENHQEKWRLERDSLLKLRYNCLYCDKRMEHKNSFCCQKCHDKYHDDFHRDLE